MTNRWNSSAYGGNGGTAFGPVTCPDGEYVTAFSGRGGRYIDKVCARCSDGTDLGCYGGNGGDPWSNNQGPYSGVSGRAGSYVDNLLGVGGGGGDPWSVGCPSGTVVVGIHGRGAGYVDKIGVTCGVDKRKYCLNNLESPVCNNIDKSILNQACKNNFTQTCRNRKYEIDESIIQSFCAKNPDDPICTCYADAPSYIPNEVRGMPKCWSQKCATTGYVPVNMRGDCPDITVCQQALDVAGTYNKLTSNVIIQNCKTDPVPTPGSPGSTPVSTVVPDTPSMTTQVTQVMTTITDTTFLNISLIYWLLIILLLPLLIIFIPKIISSSTSTSVESTSVDKKEVI